MATELDDRCPICLDSCEEPSHLMPCLHRFCYRCILRWAQSKPECPLCKRRITSILHSVEADDDFEEHVITPPDLGGLQPSTWAILFRDHPALLQTVRTWMRQELRRMFGSRHSRAEVVEALTMPLLELFGLDEEMLVQLLRACLQSRTATFVRRLIEAAVQECSGEVRRLLGLEDGHAAQERRESPAASSRPAASRGGSSTAGPAPSHSLQGANREELPGTSAAAPRGAAGSSPSAPAPLPAHQEEPQDAVEAPSTSSGATEGSRGEPRRPPKRRSSSHKASSPAKKRPPRRQH